MTDTAFTSDTVRDLFEAFEDYWRDASTGALDDGDLDAALVEAFDQVVGPLIDPAAFEERAA